MSSARLAIKFLQILFTEFAKSVQNRYKNVRYHIQLRIIVNTVQRKLPRFTYNSVRYGNNAVSAALFKFLAMKEQVLHRACDQIAHCIYTPEI